MVILNKPLERELQIATSEPLPNDKLNLQLLCALKSVLWFIIV